MTAKFGATSTTDDVLAGLDLKGKRVLVTGTSSGLGIETARALVAHGAYVVGTARDLCFETQLGTNLGHFVLVNQLALWLLAGSRVVVLSSGAHRMSDIDLEDLNFERRAYDPGSPMGSRRRLMRFLPSSSTAATRIGASALSRTACECVPQVVNAYTP